MYSASFHGVRAYVDVLQDVLAYYQGAEYDADKFKWHEQTENDVTTHYLMYDSMVVLMWSLNQVRITSVCSWACPTLH